MLASVAARGLRAAAADERVCRRSSRSWPSQLSVNKDDNAERIKLARRLEQFCSRAVQLLSTDSTATDLTDFLPSRRQAVDREATLVDWLWEWERVKWENRKMI